VDPTKDAHLTTDKWVKRLEKNVLRIRGELRTKKAEELSSKDRFRMRIYNFAKKHRILSEIEDETFIQFGAEQQKKRILENTNARITEKDKQTEQNPS
jgi:hypothetical protein